MHADLSKASRKERKAAFTLAEVVMCMAIITTLFAGIIMAYANANRRAKWSGYSLAAQALAIQQIEQARSARWDAYDPSIYEITNIASSASSSNYYNVTYTNNTLTGYSIFKLNIPYSTTNYTYATNFFSDKLVSWEGDASIPMRLVRIDVVWPFTWKNTTRLFTNSLVTYCARDN